MSPIIQTFIQIEVAAGVKALADKIKGLGFIPHELVDLGAAKLEAAAGNWVTTFLSRLIGQGHITITVPADASVSIEIT